jgi:hypothetical protein
MRTDDFSAAPPMGQATAMFVGGTRYRGPMSLIRLLPRWVRLVRQMKRMRGYCWHTVYWRFPFTFGTIALFRDRDALLRFARGSAHRDLMCWVSDDGTRIATGGFIRFFDAAPHGYTNGAWRVEDDSMAHTDTFSPLSREAAGPPVHRS